MKHKMRNRIFMAWAVADVNGKYEAYVCNRRSMARLMADMRNKSCSKVYPGAKWRVFRAKVEIRK